MARMRDIKADAKKRRAKLLSQFNRLPKGTTIAEFADKHGVTRSRMGQLIAMARDEVIK